MYWVSLMRSFLNYVSAMCSDSQESVVLGEMQESGLLHTPPKKILDVAKFMSEPRPEKQIAYSLSQAILEERAETP